MMQSRTHTCNELRGSDAGKRVQIAGWLQTFRELGETLAFMVVRDFYGITQVVVETAEMMEIAKKIPRESTVSVAGTVRMRSSVNPDIPTGDIEIVPDHIEVLGRCTEQLPFEIHKSLQSREENRLRYRFLDLRNPEVSRKIVMRSRIISEIRHMMTEKGFLEITTPILTSSSPEGARDYIVPSRVHPGKFYALPQAPQQFKQILMTSGFDRYFQIAPCFRDEDARADRSPGEFYQLDVEMAFATQEDVFAMIEGVLVPLFEKFGDKAVTPAPFRRLTYREAMERFGSDKPDLRNPLELCDLTGILAGCEFEPFHNQSIKAVAVPEFQQTRKFIDNLCSDIEKQHGSKVYWFRVGDDGDFTGGLAKFMQPFHSALADLLNLKPGTFVALAAGKKGEVEKIAGLMRSELGASLELIDKNRFEFCWITDFPMYEIGEESGELEFSHNPFSMPQGGMDALLNKNPLDILAYQYDIVCNGVELSSGAVRNHDPEIMCKAFELVGTPEDVVAAKFPAMYNAFKFGAPPHAGIAPGVDRIVMLICEEPNIREIIPFPMNKNAQDLLMGAPSSVDQKQLDDVHIMLNLPKYENDNL